MKSLINRILQDGYCLEGGILKVEAHLKKESMWTGTSCSFVM